MSTLFKKKLWLLLLAFGIGVTVKAQDVAIKTNLLYDALLNVDAGVEVGLAPHWTIDLSGSYNGWDVNGHKWKHWRVQPEARYWFCDRFMGHFLGFHAIGGEYNFGHIRNNVSFLGSDFSNLTDSRYQGWAVGGGVAYGYTWVLDRHWNFELELGVGYIYTRYDKFNCQGCGKRVETDQPHHYVGPTKAAVNLVYVF
ncbi:MAG: DUF3575 domain-containing protein [Muribaculaceae bacterium]|nr:DUF3575 domain-containing protein [Muribaculaceae bacterium]